MNANKSAYTFHRQHGKAPAVALAKAREDSAAGKSRYPASGPNRPCYQPPSNEFASRYCRERFAYLEKPESHGFRRIGEVMPEPRGNPFQTRGGPFGYYTDPYGECWKNGEGLCWGVVYQLPARDGRARFVAGYEFGGMDGGPTLDVSRVFEGAADDNCRYDGAAGNPAAREAAHAANEHARVAAENEREYQTAWQLGRIWEESRELISETRKAALALLRERRGVKGEGDGRPAICEAIRSRVSDYLETIREAREAMANAVKGDGPGLCVHMGEREREAFCDSAGLKSFPA